MAQFDQSGQTGFLLLLRSDTALEASSRGLVLSVSGDVLLGVASQLARRPPERPLTLDTAWALSDWALARGGARLARAAIVDIRGQTYVGRLCFADAASGEAAWDCDCRPSDACWLSSEAGCPLYVLRSIWDQQSIQLESMAQRHQSGTHGSWEGGREGGGLRMDGSGVERGGPRAPDPHLMERREPPRHLPGRKALSDPAPAPQFAFYRPLAPGSALALVANIRPGDPDPVRRLKMELRVALKEEDYVKAAEIRDHPFMQLQASIALAEEAGNGVQARSLRAQLLSSITETERVARAAKVERAT
ncbi:hypothetical protein H632_c682p0 [Helicosporidium sp. ATCC 50920]|nr:hypothetical protein H632_c682p0 [Helicosporidium sp. ATCC 50920]|eukprot:KDD75445.1 hypothetical protein H632_c682p0 [Helicosporidium sp. ATCC 50920]